MTFHTFRTLLTILVIGLCTFISKGTNTVIADISERQPIVGASVFSSQGLILGISDERGQLPHFSGNDLPLTIRSVGYKEARLAQTADTLFMEEEAYTLPEFTVASDERPFIKVTAYVREYCTGAMAGDTLQFYGEYMMRSFVTDREKVKGYHSSDAKAKVMNSRLYCRYLNEKRDSVAIPTDIEDVLSWKHVVSFKGREEEPAVIRTGARADTVMGKFSPLMFYEKNARTFSRKKDILGDHEGHTWSPTIFKLFGMTVDATRLQFSDVYALNESGVYCPVDMISKSYNVHMKGRGKLWKLLFRTKEPVEMDSFIEVFPVDVQFLTLQEYKEERKEDESIPFSKNDNVSPLHPTFQQIVDRVNSLP